ncbi:HNH endonuclease [Acanthamoeba polyphaga moumouvirus]|uniref:Uncharacterized protein n=1 Tax=Acanthamoeba polyphaga moumouvirus TaxID=1269028 RepID=L7RDI3_9VIRU|nr:HNH endonuclease [Acanthamoeba polyphaga moumouvirus]AGC02412.1 hypothetical protein Moumou_00897 [Acanthamoeba polyphaga moumouvirus]
MNFESLEKYLLDENTSFHGSTFDYFNFNRNKFLLNRESTAKEKFINKAKEIHGDKYDYSFVDYKTRVVEVKIKCNNCGHTFNIKPNSHLIYKKGCDICYSTKEQKRFILEKNFIDKLKARYGSELIYTNIKYFGRRDKIIITCSKCMYDYLREPESLFRRRFKCRFCKTDSKKRHNE